MDSRRSFLAGLAWAGTLGGLSVTLLAEQLPQTTQGKKPGQDASPDGPALPSPEKRALEENEKDIKKKVERLYELATELKAEVDKTDSSKVLSLTMLKKAEEIEKLAKDIKTRSKG